MADYYRKVRLAAALLLLSAVFLGALAFVLEDVGDLAWLALFDFALGIVILLAISRPFSVRVARRAQASVIGEIVELTFDETGMSFSSPAASGLVQWSQMTDVREDARTVVFMRDKWLSAWIPVSAFANGGQRREIVSFAEQHIAAARSTASRL